MKKTFKIILFALFAILLGGLVGIVTAGFLHFIEWGQELVWIELSDNTFWQKLCLCTFGGLLVGVCQRYLGDHPQNINEAIAEIGQTGRLDYKHLPHGITTASVSLIFGASLGPESAIIGLLGGLSTWAGDVINRARNFLHLSLSAPSKNKFFNVLRHWPLIIALAGGGFALVYGIGDMYSAGFLAMTVPFRWQDLLWGFPMGILGAAAGSFFVVVQSYTVKLIIPYRSKPILLGILSGLLLGLAAVTLPMMLFSGQHQLQQIYDQAIQLGFWILFFIGLIRLLMINVLLACGWKGGQFLPLMFASAALGLSATILFPMIPAPAAVLGVMSALLAVVLPKPIFSLLLMALMFPLQYIGIAVVAVGLVVIGKKRWPHFQIQSQHQPAEAELSPPIVS